MTDHEKLTPEEADIRNQALLRDLEYMYAPADEAQSLEHIRNRLRMAEHTSSFNSVQPTSQLTRTIRHERISPMFDRHVPMVHKKARYLNILVASVVVLLLIGSVLFAVSRASQSNTGGPGHSYISTSAAPVTPTPTAGFGPDWEIITSFAGKGSFTTQDLHFKSEYALGAYFTCTGDGNVNIVIGQIGLSTTCRAAADGVFDVWKGSYSLDKIDIIDTKNSSWQIELASCVNGSNCSSNTMLMPTSVPTSIPAPTPTVVGPTH